LNRLEKDSKIMAACETFKYFINEPLADGEKFPPENSHKMVGFF
jgi:hypothetical protein